MQWFGLFAPSGTPASVLAYLHGEAAAALRSSDVQKRLAADGADAVGNSPEAFAAQLRQELAKWESVARAAKLK